MPAWLLSSQERSHCTSCAGDFTQMRLVVATAYEVLQQSRNKCSTILADGCSARTTYMFAYSDAHLIPPLTSFDGACLVLLPLASLIAHCLISCISPAPFLQSHNHPHSLMYASS
jgi:hypothetical protein